MAPELPDDRAAEVGAARRGSPDLRFDGWIGGFGTAAGLRAVVGHWPRSPFGPFTDVMVEQPDGCRILLAPTSVTADFVARTYRFDEVRVVPVTATVAVPDDRRSPAVVRRAARFPEGSAAPLGRWRVEAGPFVLSFEIGARPALGWLLRAVPRPLATAVWWVAAIDAVARRVLPGVRTRGSAGAGRQEFYAALDLRRIAGATLMWDGADQGGLAPVDPPVRFGFGSTPRDPSVARIVTLVRG